MGRSLQFRFLLICRKKWARNKRNKSLGFACYSHISWTSSSRFGGLKGIALGYIKYPEWRKGILCVFTCTWWFCYLFVGWWFIPIFGKKNPRNPKQVFGFLSPMVAQLQLHLQFFLESLLDKSSPPINVLWFRDVWRAFSAREKHQDRGGVLPSNFEFRCFNPPRNQLN